MRGFRACLLGLLLAPFSTVSAQEPLPIEPGQRVRVTAAGLGMNKQAATFHSLDGGILTVTTDSTLQCPLSDVTRLDVHQGRHGHPWRGAGIGFGAGVVAGVFTALLVCQGQQGQDCYDESTDMTWLIAEISGASGGLVGAGIGALIGANVKTDRWEEVPLDELRVHSLVTPDGRFGLGVSLRF